MLVNFWPFELIIFIIFKDCIEFALGLDDLNHGEGILPYHHKTLYIYDVHMGKVLSGAKELYDMLSLPSLHNIFLVFLACISQPILPRFKMYVYY